MFKSKSIDLVFLDLDHTLILGSYRELPELNLMFKYGSWLWVYQRPGAVEFARRVCRIAPTFVYTTAMKDYATQAVLKLAFKPQNILTRENCLRVGDAYRKSVKHVGHEVTSSTLIIDDSPEVWLAEEIAICRLLAPKRWMGENDDNVLNEITSHLI